MAKKKRYTDEERAAAVIWLEAAGYPGTKGALARVARESGIRHQTLRRWYWAEQNPPPPQLVHEKRREMREILLDIVYGFSEEVLRRVKSGEVKDAPLNQLMHGFGVSFDKLQLTQGKPTEIVDDAGLTDDQRAERIASLLDRARARRTGQITDWKDTPRLQ